MIARITGTGDGSAPTVNLTFPFIDKDHIKASVNGTVVGFTWTTQSQLKFNAAVPVGTPWAVYRETPTNPGVVDFTQTSVLTEADLDKADLAHRYRDEELADLNSQAVADAAAEVLNRIAAINNEAAARAAGDAAMLASLSGVIAQNPSLNASSRALLAQLDRTLGLPAFLTESGREGLFVFDPSNLSAKVTADPQQGIYVAPSSDTTGTSGAWVRQFHGAPTARMFGAVGDNATDDKVAINAAITTIGSLGLGQFRFDHGHTFYSSGPIIFGANGLLIVGEGATLRSAANFADGAAFEWSGNSTQTFGLTLYQSGATSPYAEVTGSDVVIEGNTFTRDATSSIPFYHRNTATGFRFRYNHCTWYGGINFISDPVDVDIVGNSFINPVAGASDDGLAIKSTGTGALRIRIVGNYFEGTANFVGIGSNIGGDAVNDPTYSHFVTGVIIDGNFGWKCTGMVLIKPGALDGQDWRDGTVRGVTISNNLLVDLDGTNMGYGIGVTAGRGARVYDVTGSGNKMIGRLKPGGANPYGFYLFLRDDTGIGTAPSIIDNIHVGIEVSDPYGGVVAGGSAPGAPISVAWDAQKQTAGVGTVSRVVVDVTANGINTNGVNIGAGLDGGVHIERAILTNVNINGSTNYGGISIASKVTVGNDVRITGLGGTSQPYVIPVATGSIVSRVDTLYLEKSVAAGASSSSRAIRWAAPQNSFVHKVEIVSSTAIAQSADDLNYTQHEVRNEDGGGAPFTVTSKLTGGMALPAGVFNRIYDLLNLGGGPLADCAYVKDARMSYTKTDFGTGNAVTDAYLRIHWAPY